MACALVECGCLPASDCDPPVDFAKRLTEGDIEARCYAAKRLAEKGPQAVGAVPELIEALKDDNEEFNREVTTALRAIGKPSVSQLLRFIENKDRPVVQRAKCLQVIRGMDHNCAELSLPVLLKALNGDEPLLQVEALSSIGDYYVRDVDDRRRIAKLFLRHVLEVVTDKNTGKDVLLQGICTLGDFGPNARDAIPSLLLIAEEQFVKEEIYTGQAGFFALANIGSDSVPGLVNIIKNPGKRQSVRLEALHALREMARGTAADSVPFLISTLKDDDQLVRCVVADTLASVGAHDNDTLPALEVFINTGTQIDRIVGARAMFSIDRKNPISIPTFIQCLLGSDKDSRHRAVTELRVVGSDIEPYVAEIVSRIREADCDVQICVVNVLENLGPNGKEYIPVLESIAKDNVKEVKQEAEKAIKTIQKSLQK
ncbi:MAG: HEAT repeat domain-containing protein [Gemmataceae bacterium]